MALAPTKVYLNNTESIPVLFDLEDSGQKEHLRVLTASFGEKYAMREYLASHRYCLQLLPGGVLALLERKPPFSSKRGATA